MKQRFRRTRVACLSDLERVVNSSAEANVAQLVGTQSGEVVVPTYNWTAMFAGRLHKLKYIKKFHHFSISESALGSVDVRMESDSESEHISLLMDHTWTPSSQQLPQVIPPSGLSLERQWYLHSQIREYCPDEVRDEVCPQPLAPLSSTIPSTNASSSTAARSSLNTAQSTSLGGIQDHPPPPTKRARICSKCRIAGHNARTCEIAHHCYLPLYFSLSSHPHCLYLCLLHTQFATFYERYRCSKLLILKITPLAYVHTFYYIYPSYQ